MLPSENIIDTLGSRLAHHLFVLQLREEFSYSPVNTTPSKDSLRSPLYRVYDKSWNHF